MPSTSTVGLEKYGARPGAGTPGDSCAAGAPGRVDVDLVVDDPGASVLDGGRTACDQVTIVGGLEQDDLEARASDLMSPRPTRRRGQGRHAAPLARPPRPVQGPAARDILPSSEYRLRIDTRTRSACEGEQPWASDPAVLGHRRSFRLWGTGNRSDPGRCMGHQVYAAP